MAETTNEHYNGVGIHEQVHPDYADTYREVKKVRDCVEGSHRVKELTYTYLRHPSQIDTESEEQRLRYLWYLEGAEYNNYPDKTRRNLLGKMRINNTSVELPQGVEYLEEDVDGDGMPLKSAIELSVSNVMQTKWHALVADYDGLSDLNVDAVIADVEEQSPRAKIKQYARESVVNWHFERVNGVMQLKWIMLLELGTEFDPDHFWHDTIESYLILGLDEDGEYYQQKIVYSPHGKREGERSYVTVNGDPLKWIPIVFVADEEMQQGSLPRQMGLLHPICEAALHQYRVSAVYKETQRASVPTRWTRGWKGGDKEIFQEINGRDYQVVGGYGANNYPNDVEVGILSASADMDDFHWYLEGKDKQIKEMGGTSDKENQMTAKEAEINASDQNALLETVANNAEKSWARAVSYCGMFEGLWAPSDVESQLEDISIKMPRDFASPRLSVDEVRTVIELYMSGLISRDEVLRQIESGGWLLSDIESLADEMDSAGPAVNNLTQEP